MRSSVLAMGTLPAFGALLLLVHPPAQARMLVLHSAMCGSAARIMIPVGHIPKHRRDDRPCPAGCHVACAPRKNHKVKGDIDES